MSLSPPPDKGHLQPQLHVLRAGTNVWRVHSKQFEPTQFNPGPPPPQGGGRFDSENGSYAHLYAAQDTIAAIAETLLRDHPPSGAYQLPFKRVQDKRISKLRLMRDLPVVSLHGSGLTAVRQTAELTASSPLEYPTTRAWARALRNAAASAVGLEWRPRHDNDRFAYVFYGDRCSQADFTVEATYELAQGSGLRLLRNALNRHSATVDVPER
jgi:hypothetical protein